MGEVPARAREKGETDDMDYKHNVYVYQTEWANRVAADYGSVFQPITDYMNTGAPTSSCCCPATASATCRRY
ncbi:MAG: hypothetical protein ACLSVD_07315 [Eggerthellaceae bacterium]